MAQRFKAEQLQEMIRSLVRKEMRENLAEMMNEILSERYLKQLAKQLVETNMPRGVNKLDIQGEDPIDGDSPAVLGQTDEWPYRDPQFPGKHDDKIDERAKTGPMSMFFEGTRPLTEIEAHHAEGLQINEGSETVDVWKKMMKGMDAVAARTRPAQTPMTQEEAERRLAEKRKALEVKPS